MRISTLAAAVSAAIVLASSPLTLQAQSRVPPELTLETALELARGSNPTYLQAANDVVLADWEVRQAWGSLLPSANASSSLTWQGPGEQQFGTLTLGDLGFGGQPAFYFSNYNLGMNLDVSWSSLLAPRQARAERSATEARVRGSEAELVAQVTTAYLEVLRQQEALELARAQLESARFNLRLAQGQLEVGAATPIDVGQAEVQVGRAEVTVLQTENALETARMRLLQQMGVPVDQEVALVTEFEVTEPAWTVEELLELAFRTNPGLLATERSRRAADVAVGQARSAYYPSLSLSTGWSGFTREAADVDFQIAQAQAQVASSVSQCVQTNEIYRRLADPLPTADCTRFAFTDAQRNAIISRNDQFPFNFETAPLSASLTIRLPIFQGLSRQRNLEAAQVQRDDLAQQLRGQELALRADVAVEVANVRTAWRSALLEERNRELAEQQLRLARERYQLGAITFVELVDAQTVLAQAQRDRNAAVFFYHDAVTRLEALVGVPLRDQEPSRP
jgi:outer membrane protein